MTALEIGPSTLALAFGAGLASVASPCVLPVVPVIVTGTAEDHRWRPALCNWAANMLPWGSRPAKTGRRRVWL